MKDYAWQIIELYSNHAKHASHRDGVEMNAAGEGVRWTWEARTTSGALIGKFGEASSLDEAKKKAEGAAKGLRALVANARHVGRAIPRERRAKPNPVRTSPRHRGRG